MKMMNSLNDKTATTRLVLVLTGGLVIAMLGIGCGDNSQKDPDAGPDSDAEIVCAPGSFVACDGDDAIICDIDGSSTVRSACGLAGCNADMERCNDCVPGSGRVCYEGNIAECSSHGEELSSEHCSFGCTQVGGVATCNECHPDETQCHGDALVTCGVGGTIETSVVCDQGCSTERAACNDCPPLEVGCNGDELMACDADGLVEESEICDHGCSDDLLACLCEAGGATCDGDILRTCSATGIPESAEWCPNGCGSNGTSDWCQQCNPQVPQFCDGADLMACDSTGHLGLIETCPLGCNAWTEPQRCYSFVPTNLQESDLTAGSANLTPSINITIDTTQDGQPPRVNGAVPDSWRVFSQSASDAPDIVVIHYRNITVGNIVSGCVITMTGRRGLALVASEEIKINGMSRIHAGAAFGTPGPGGRDINSTPSSAADGANAVDTTTCEFNGPGAGGGGYADSGGAGGSITFNGAPIEDGGAGGDPIGDSALVTMYGGARGGASYCPTNPTPGAGGGVLLLVARRSIWIGRTVNIIPPSRGSVFATGGGGEGATGGGAGGTILLEAPTVIHQGILSTVGGGGGCSLYDGSGSDGQIGGAGCLGVGNANPGGSGGGTGASLAGENAPDTTSWCVAGDDGGGGGGAAGRILIKVSPYGSSLTLGSAAESLGAVTYSYIEPF